jgi:hypothetical protein
MRRYLDHVARKKITMNNEELQRQINALVRLQFALATAVNQLSALSSNEALLEVAPNPQSFEDLTSSLQDFVMQSRNYKNYARTQGRWIFSFLTSQAALDSLEAATAKNLPAVAGIAESVIQESIRRGRELTDVDRQFIGAVVRFLMEANGYRKTGRHGFITYKPFTKGQLYQQILN